MPQVLSLHRPPVMRNHYQKKIQKIEGFHGEGTSHEKYSNVERDIQ
jgi:hypothetical protein